VTLVDINGDQEADYVIYGGSIVPGPPPPTMQPSKDVMKDHVIPIVVPLLTALIGAAGASFAAGRKLKGEMTKAAAAPKDS
jgi:hypothetical protein